MVLKAPALATMKTDNLAVTTTRSASLSKTALEAAGGYIYIIIYNINYIYMHICEFFFFTVSEIGHDWLSGRPVLLMFF
jgi:hypothetical protein